MSLPASPSTPACRNCYQPLGPERPRFCPHCGQETTLRPPTLFEFAQQFGGAIVSTEGALWRTLKLLVLRPGELTRQYLAGRRKHYVAPVRLYLTASVLALLLLRLTAGDSTDVAVVGAGGTSHIPGKIHIGVGPAKARDMIASKADGSTEKKADTAADPQAAPEGTNDDKFTCENAPRWLCDRLARRFGGDRGQIERAVAEIGERFIANVGTLMFVLLPCFALYTKLAWWRRDLRYTEHLVFALHLHAFWFLALILTVPSPWWLGMPAFAWMAIYALLAMKHVFGGRAWALALRAATISVVYATTLSVGVALLGLAVAIA